MGVLSLATAAIGVGPVRDSRGSNRPRRTPQCSLVQSTLPPHPHDAPPCSSVGLSKRHPAAMAVGTGVILPNWQSRHHHLNCRGHHHCLPPSTYNTPPQPSSMQNHISSVHPTVVHQNEFAGQSVLDKQKELRQYPNLRAEVTNAACESLDRMRNESKMKTLK